MFSQSLNQFPYIVLDIDSTPPFDPIDNGAICIPPKTILFRGYNTSYPTISHRPMHLGTEKNATSYAQRENYALGIFSTTKFINLIDIRYLRVILQRMFSMRPSNAQHIIEPIGRISVSHGLCSLSKQLEIAKKMYSVPSHNLNSLIKWYEENIVKQIDQMPLNVYPIELQGMRIAETNNDAYTTQFLAELFHNSGIDGFYAPAVWSPFSIEKAGNILPSEIVIFNPLESCIHQLDRLPHQYINMTIYELVQKQTVRIEHQHSSTGLVSSRRRRVQYNGGSVDQCIYDPNAFFDKIGAGKASAEEKKLYNSAMKSGRIWAKHLNFSVPRISLPHPILQVSNWLETQNRNSTFVEKQ